MPLTKPPADAVQPRMDGRDSGSHAVWLCRTHPSAVAVAGDVMRAITYSEASVWVAPRRHLRRVGSVPIGALLLEEFAAMLEPELTRLRTAVHGNQLVDEYSLRFRYRGCGIVGVELSSGALVELHRIRILTLEREVIVHEVSIETWTAIAALGARNPAPQAVPRVPSGPAGPRR